VEELCRDPCEPLVYGEMGVRVNPDLGNLLRPWIVFL